VVGLVSVGGMCVVRRGEAFRCVGLCGRCRGSGVCGVTRCVWGVVVGYVGARWGWLVYEFWGCRLVCRGGGLRRKLRMVRGGGFGI